MVDLNDKRGEAHSGTLAAARCTTALVAVLTANWLLNYSVFPLCDQTWLWIRELSAVAGGLGLAALAFYAYWRPQALSSRRMAMLLLGFAGLGIPCFVAGSAFSLAALLACGATLLTLAAGFAMVVTGVAASTLAWRPLSLCAIVAYCIAYALRAPLTLLPTSMNCLLFFLLPLVSMGLCLASSRPVLDQTYSSGSPAEVALEAPSSFLPFGHQLFITLLLFRFIYGFSLTFGEVERIPLLAPWSLLPLGLVLLLCVAARRPLSPDALFKLSILFSTAGFLLIAINLLPDEASTLLSCGTGFFEVFMFYILAALGSKNRIAALPLFAWGSTMDSWGTLLGANFGRIVNGAFSYPDIAALTAAAIVFGLVGYLLLLHGSSSFAATLDDMAPPPPVLTVHAADGEAISLEKRCEDLGRRHELTAREQEVFEYLARGRNIRFIEEELVVSYNTVKTHVSHIYAKLGVHSHQELINLVENSTPAEHS